MNEPIRVLLVEDNADDAEMVMRALRNQGMEFSIERVDTEEEYLKHLRPTLDIVLSDYKMPQFDGLRALDLLMKSELALPFILISGTIGEDTAVEAMRRGAADYLLKDRLGRLGTAIRHALEKNHLGKERLRGEIALRESGERLKLALEASGMGVWEWDPGADSIFWSPECHAILGVRDLSSSARDCLLLLHPEDADRVIAAWRHAIGNHTIFTAEFRIVRPNGDVRWLVSRGNAKWDENGRPLRMVGTMQDVTERRQLEEQLRQSQKMEAIGQLAGGLAHDFNNILTVIEGYSTLLEQNLIETGEATREISLAVERAAGLSRQLLTFSRKQVMQPCDLDLNAVVMDMTKMLRRTLGEDITLVVEPAPDIPLIYADQGMMEQILLNLGVNARDAMPNGGRLLISTAAVNFVETAGPEASDMPGRPEEPGVCLRVADQGCGIPAEILSRIFEPFFTTKEVNKGTGLGLATVHGIVKQHRGSIRVTSEVGHGATFEITLPASKIGAVSTGKKPAEPAGNGGHETILLVDDEPTLRMMVKRALKQFGYSVLEAGSGKQALAVFEESGAEIDLLLTDMVMPEGMSGKDLAEQLKAKSPALRILYTSGYSAELVSRRMDSQGIHFLQKPYNMRHLATAIRNCLDG
jgi:two-component system, cell cycle sensor histidine kinase and response regulator CckA